MPRVVLTIAGSDSGAGAGIQADLKTITACGAYATSAVTAITAQNTLGVDAMENISANMVYAQIKSIAVDFKIDAAKTGMLANEEIAAAVVKAVRDFSLPNLVVDTVMVAKGGERLLLAGAEILLRTQLLPLALIATPNLPEASALLQRDVLCYEDMHQAAVDLFALGPKNILLKGGHLTEGPAVDIFYDGKKFTELSLPRIETKATHGTGCTLSAAIAANLAQDMQPLEACRAAKQYIAKAIATGLTIGHGHRPLNHFWSCTSPLKKSDTLSYESENRT